MATEVVVAGYARTPVGAFGGALKDVPVTDLAALAIREAVSRVSSLDPGDVGEVVFGNVENRTDESCLGRAAALRAGLPVTTTGYGVNRLCGSGMQAIHLAAQSLLLGNAEVAVAGGAESMNRYRYALSGARFGYRMGDGALIDTLTEILSNPETRLHGASVVEKLAERYAIGREEQDRFALSSHRKALAAQEAGRFAAEIVPVEVTGRRGEVTVVARDAGPRADTSLDSLARLRPLFPGGTITPGNSSTINDGAAAMVLMTRRRAEAMGIRPIASIVSMAVAGVEPDYFGLGPVPAIRLALQRAGLTLDQVGLVEINEAFAVQTLACQQELEIDPDRLNVNGGAIALGHALGNSGARISITLLGEMQRRKVEYGVASLCIGQGMGIATLFRLEV